MPTPTCMMIRGVVSHAHLCVSQAVDRLSKCHVEHISQYGLGNEERLTGKHETCDINTFRHGEMSVRSAAHSETEWRQADEHTLMLNVEGTHIICHTQVPYGVCIFFL